MAATNDEMQAQSKPRVSPLEYRNTDLVSRLLAATPPYLYNMSLAPNTYFFSEMLRSFVQAKTDRTTTTLARRSRKRSWTQTKSTELPKKLSIEDLNWKPDNQFYEEPPNTKHLSQQNESFTDYKDHKEFKDKTYAFQPPLSQQPSHNSHSHQPQQQPQQHAENSSNLILPPPPPIWYPPLYSATPYGIDPLHFFIDLRVSGHIYDRKKSLEKPEQTESNATPFKDLTLNKPTNILRTSKHASAFSVPTKNHPINLSKEDAEYKPLKFDVKSLGLEGTHNKTGVNYVMNNIERVYKDLQEYYETTKFESNDDKKKRELRELISLELAADYMNQNKPLRSPNQSSDRSNADSTQEGDAGLMVEVVDVQDDDAELDT